jgi:hypothetical protein
LKKEWKDENQSLKESWFKSHRQDIDIDPFCAGSQHNGSASKFLRRKVTAEDHDEADGDYCEKYFVEKLPDNLKQASLCGICGGQGGSGIDFSASISGFL